MTPRVSRVLERLCPTEHDTRRAGEDLAAWLVKGDVVLLAGDLGSGKTVFVRGLAKGLGADPDEVSSPTFALVHEYGPEGGEPLLLHADLYRLPEEEARREDLRELGLERALGRGAILAIEWPRPPYTEWDAWRVEIREATSGARVVKAWMERSGEVR